MGGGRRGWRAYVWKELGDVVDLVLDDEPAVLLVVVLLDLCARECGGHAYCDPRGGPGELQLMEKAACDTRCVKPNRRKKKRRQNHWCR